MSTANFGVSRFEESVVYAPVTFNKGLTSSSIDAGSDKLTLTSASGVYLEGLLANQDIQSDSFPAIIVLANIALYQTIRITEARAFLLPVGLNNITVPQGIRMRMFIDAAVVVNFVTTIVSGASIKLLRITDAGVTFNNYNAGTVTANLGQDTYVTVESFDVYWLITSISN